MHRPELKKHIEHQRFMASFLSPRQISTEQNFFQSNKKSTKNIQSNKNNPKNFTQYIQRESINNKFNSLDQNQNQSQIKNGPLLLSLNKYTNDEKSQADYQDSQKKLRFSKQNSHRKDSSTAQTAQRTTFYKTNYSSYNSQKNININQINNQIDVHKENLQQKNYKQNPDSQQIIQQKNNVLKSFYETQDFNKKLYQRNYSQPYLIGEKQNDYYNNSQQIDYYDKSSFQQKQYINLNPNYLKTNNEGFNYKQKGQLQQNKRQESNDDKQTKQQNYQKQIQQDQVQSSFQNNLACSDYKSLRMQKKNQQSISTQNLIFNSSSYQNNNINIGIKNKNSEYGKINGLKIKNVNNQESTNKKYENQQNNKVVKNQFPQDYYQYRNNINQGINDKLKDGSFTSMDNSKTSLQKNNQVKQLNQPTERQNYTSLGEKRNKNQEIVYTQNKVALQSEKQYQNIKTQIANQQHPIRTIFLEKQQKNQQQKSQDIHEKDENQTKIINDEAQQQESENVKKNPVLNIFKSQILSKNKFNKNDDNPISSIRFQENTDQKQDNNQNQPNYFQQQSVTHRNLEKIKTENQSLEYSLNQNEANQSKAFLSPKNMNLLKTYENVEKFNQIDQDKNNQQNLSLFESNDLKRQAVQLKYMAQKQDMMFLFIKDGNLDNLKYKQQLVYNFHYINTKKQILSQKQLNQSLDKTKQEISYKLQFTQNQKVYFYYFNGEEVQHPFIDNFQTTIIVSSSPSFKGIKYGDHKYYKFFKWIQNLQNNLFIQRNYKQFIDDLQQSEENNTNDRYKIQKQMQMSKSQKKSINYINLIDDKKSKQDSLKFFLEYYQNQVENYEKDVQINFKIQHENFEEFLYLEKKLLFLKKFQIALQQYTMKLKEEMLNQKLVGNQLQQEYDMQNKFIKNVVQQQNQNKKLQYQQTNSYNQLSSAPQSLANLGSLQSSENNNINSQFQFSLNNSKLDKNHQQQLLLSKFSSLNNQHSINKDYIYNSEVSASQQNSNYPNNKDNNQYNYEKEISTQYSTTINNIINTLQIPKVQKISNAPSYYSSLQYLHSPRLAKESERKRLKEEKKNQKNQQKKIQQMVQQNLNLNSDQLEDLYKLVKKNKKKENKKIGEILEQEINSKKLKNPIKVKNNTELQKSDSCLSQSILPSSKNKQIEEWQYKNKEEYLEAEGILQKTSNLKNLSQLDLFYEKQLQQCQFVSMEQEEQGRYQTKKYEPQDHITRLIKGKNKIKAIAEDMDLFKPIQYEPHPYLFTPPQSPKNEKRSKRQNKNNSSSEDLDEFDSSIISEESEILDNKDKNNYQIALHVTTPKNKNTNVHKIQSYFEQEQDEVQEKIENNLSNLLNNAIKVQKANDNKDISSYSQRQYDWNLSRSQSQQRQQLYQQEFSLNQQTSQKSIKSDKQLNLNSNLSQLFQQNANKNNQQIQNSGQSLNINQNQVPTINMNTSNEQSVEDKIKLSLAATQIQSRRKSQIVGLMGIKTKSALEQQSLMDNSISLKKEKQNQIQQELEAAKNNKNILSILVDDINQKNKNKSFFKIQEEEEEKQQLTQQEESNLENEEILSPNSRIKQKVDKFEIDFPEKKKQDRTHIDKNIKKLETKKEVIRKIGKVNMNLQQLNIPQILNQIPEYFIDKNIKKSDKPSNFTRRDIHQMYILYKALHEVTSQRYPSYKLDDGLDYDTYRNGIYQVYMYSEELAQRVFRLIDYNFSGFMDWQEFIKLMVSISAKTLSEKINLFIKIADEDGNGSLSWEEIYDLAKICLSKYIKNEDDGFLEMLCEYYTKLIFQIVNVDVNEEIPLELIKQTIINSKNAEGDLLCMFCGADI